MQNLLKLVSNNRADLFLQNLWKEDDKNVL